MNVFEFIREKKDDFQENTAQFKAMVEPRFKTLSDKINHKITNTLNNPWIAGFGPFDSSTFFSLTKESIHPSVAQAMTVLEKKIGVETFVGEWETISQDRINQFATLTDDKQWIHTDPEKAKVESPFKTTIAHGFLTLAMIPKLTESIQNKDDIYPDAKLIVNYGLNQVRFPFSVRSGSKIRARSKLIQLTPMKKSIELVNEVSIEVENKKRFACVAETVLRLYF